MTYNLKSFIYSLTSVWYTSRMNTLMNMNTYIRIYMHTCGYNSHYMMYLCQLFLEFQDPSTKSMDFSTCRSLSFT